jgi:phosphoketolase
VAGDRAGDAEGLDGAEGGRRQAHRGQLLSHQVPLAGVRDDPAQLEAWLRSYRPEQLFDERGAPHDEIAALASADERMGAKPHANGGRLLRDYAPGGWPGFGVAGVSAGASAVCGGGVGMSPAGE